MAKEINIQLYVKAAKNAVVFDQNLPLTLDMTGDEMFSNSQIIGTATETILSADVVSIGYVAMKNLDATNYVEISIDNASAQKFMRLRPGHVALFPAAQLPIYAKAHTAPCRLFVMMFEL